MWLPTQPVGWIIFDFIYHDYGMHQLWLYSAFVLQMLLSADTDLQWLMCWLFRFGMRRQGFQFSASMAAWNVHGHDLVSIDGSHVNYVWNWTEHPNLRVCLSMGDHILKWLSWVFWRFGRTLHPLGGDYISVFQYSLYPVCMNVVWHEPFQGTLVTQTSVFTVVTRVFAEGTIWWVVERNLMLLASLQGPVYGAPLPYLRQLGYES